MSNFATTPHRPKAPPRKGLPFESKIGPTALPGEPVTIIWFKNSKVRITDSHTLIGEPRGMPTSLAQSDSHASAISRDGASTPSLKERSSKQLPYDIEKMIVLWSIEPHDTLDDVQIRWGRCMLAQGFTKEEALASIRGRKTLDALLAANPLWTWSVALESRSPKNYFAVAKRYGAQLSEALPTVDSRQYWAAKVFVETAMDLMKGQPRDRQFNDEEFYTAALSRDPSVLCHIPPKQRSWALYEKACRLDLSLLRLIPDSVLGEEANLSRAIELTVAAISGDQSRPRDGKALQFEALPDVLKQQPQVVVAAVKRHPSVLRHTTPQALGDTVYRELCNEVFQKDPTILEFLPPEFLSEEMIQAVLQQSSYFRLTQYIPVERIPLQAWTDLAKYFLRSESEGAHESLHHVPDKAFASACRELAYPIWALRSYFLRANDALPSMTAERRIAIRDAFKSAISRDPHNAQFVPHELKREVAAHFPHNLSVLTILLDPKEVEALLGLDLPSPVLPQPSEPGCCSIS